MRRCTTAAEMAEIIEVTCMNHRFPYEKHSNLSWTINSKPVTFTREELETSAYGAVVDLIRVRLLATTPGGYDFEKDTA